MTDRERELLEALASYEDFKSVPLLQYRHPDLKKYTRHQLFASAGVLFRAGLILRTITNPEREARYRITDDGRAVVGSADHIADDSHSEYEPAEVQQSDYER